MKHSESGRGIGLTLIVILAALLLIVLLVTGQMKSLGFGAQPQEGPAQNPVQQAQEVVDAVNDLSQRTLEIGQ